jgi:hypothetical protein
MTHLDELINQKNALTAKLAMVDQAIANEAIQKSDLEMLSFQPDNIEKLVGLALHSMSIQELIDMAQISKNTYYNILRSPENCNLSSITSLLNVLGKQLYIGPKR